MMNQDYVQTLLLPHLVLSVMVHRCTQLDQFDDQFELIDPFLLSTVFQLVLVLISIVF
jgi:hypothetical protein